MNRILITAGAMAAMLATQQAIAGPLDPDCTAEKAARSAATKATVGVGGRCDPKETAADTAKRAGGVEDKGPRDKRRDDDTSKGAVKGAANKVAK